ncbi:MAG: hypothetical protein JWO03_1974 [Bacteroidetes bacterium]|nr:hypothetical protein [Bacteroidota bacterium]
MKRLPLLFALMMAITSVKASDTLTIRQVFNFNVGDTLDYKTISEFSYPFDHYSEGMIRYYISGKTFSPDSQTITYQRQQLFPSQGGLQYLTYTDLDSSIIHFDTIGGYYGYQVQGARDSLNLITTTCSGSSTDNGFTHTYTEGLGRTYYRRGYGNIADGGGDDDTMLIYYARGGTAHGTPYYLAHGEQYIHYTPLPETCAVWNMLSGGLQEQIHTGNIISHNGHRYVEMIYRSYDPYNGAFTPDSLLGYFYNDSIARSVYFATSLSGVPRELYNFHSASSGLSCSGFFNVNQRLYGGRLLSHWYTDIACDYYYGHYCSFDYIEGIGGTAGLINVKMFGGRYIGYLTSLCVCGNVIYSTTTTASCALLTGLSDLDEDKPAIHLYPNPTTDILHLSLPDAGKYNRHLTLINLIGQEVYSSPISDTETTYDISNLPSGIYTWRINTDQGIIKTGKVVKE